MCAHLQSPSPPTSVLTQSHGEGGRFRESQQRPLGPAASEAQLSAQPVCASPETACHAGRAGTKSRGRRAREKSPQGRDQKVWI